MLKIKESVNLQELEKFGFVKFENRVHAGYSDRGTETGYRLELYNTAFEVIESRNNWKWNGCNDIRILELDGTDYDVFTRPEELDIIFDLIQQGFIEKTKD